MRKVSAHYYLRPDGTLGKRPVIEFDDAGVIVRIRELGDSFREEPGLEYYPGIMIPAFVATIDGADASISKKQARKNGVLRIKEGDSTLNETDYLQAWTAVKSNSKADSLLTRLTKHTRDAARLISAEKWGILKEGTQPGILVLQNVDLRDLTLTEKTSFKIIQK
ncbi:hypothetical protein [Carboxylicivirga sp. RSCT41]|uniref:hypothetical protein n=1 Tax=Carboxylicivirga agarovorans TaxID=3417570 RepID=UPI003D32D077